MRDLRLLPVAAAAWGAALLCVLLPELVWVCVGTCAAAAAGALVFSRSGRRAKNTRRAEVGVTIVVLSAMAGAAVSVGFALPARDEAREWGGRVIESSAEVTSSASLGRDGRLWFEAAATTLGPPGRAAPSTVPVRVGVDPADGFDLGARIRVVGESSITEAGERSALVIFASEAEIVDPASGVFAAAAAIKSTFVERALRLPEPGAGLLPGLAVGDTRAVTTALNDDMRASGLSHLTAVSGVIVHKGAGSAHPLTREGQDEYASRTRARLMSTNIATRSRYCTHGRGVPRRERWRPGVSRSRGRPRGDGN